MNFAVHPSPISTWRLRVHGLPVAQGRARAFVPKGSTRPRLYDPSQSRLWKRTVAFMASQQRPAQLFSGPLAMELRFYFPRPASAPKRVTMHTTKPDIDNLGKAIKDAIQGVVYHDDCQIVTSTVSKQFATIEEPPGVWIRVQVLDGEGAGHGKSAKSGNGGAGGGSASP